MNKKVKNSEEAQKIQTIPKDPRGWIQWKGTDVCMDVHCSCGKMTHIDSEFAYHIKCGVCGRVYFCNANIELIELEEEPDYCVKVTDQNE